MEKSDWKNKGMIVCAALGALTAVVWGREAEPARRGVDARSGAAAVVVEVVPSAATIPAGGTLTVDVQISGLGNLASPSLGAFDLNLAFDPAVLSFASISFGTFLGDAGLGEAITGSVSLAGSVDASGVSLLSVAALNALQPDSFVLYTITFDALAAGASTLDLELNAALGDENGNPLATTLVDAGVNVAAAPVATEIPTLSEWGLLLLLAGLLLIGIHRIQGGL